MFVYRIYQIDDRGHFAFREDLPVELNSTQAIAQAEAAAIDCVVELWRGGNLLGTFRPAAIDN